MCVCVVYVSFVCLLSRFLTCLCLGRGHSAYLRAKELLKDRQADLHSLAKGLLKYETLDSQEIMQVIRGEELARDISYEDVELPNPTI